MAMIDPKTTMITTSISGFTVSFIETVWPILMSVKVVNQTFSLYSPPERMLIGIKASFLELAGIVSVTNFSALTAGSGEEV